MEILDYLKSHSILSGFRNVYEKSQELNNIVKGNCVLIPKKCNFMVYSNLFSSNMSMPLSLNIVFSGRNGACSSLGYGHKFSFEKEIFSVNGLLSDFFVIDSDSTGIRYLRDYRDDELNTIYRTYTNNLKAVLSNVISSKEENNKTIQFRTLTFNDINNSSYIYSVVETKSIVDGAELSQFQIMPQAYSYKDGTMHIFNYDVNNNYKIVSIQTSNYEKAYFEYCEDNENLINRIKIKRLNEDNNEEIIKTIKFYYKTINIDNDNVPFLNVVKIFHNKNNVEMEMDTGSILDPNIENKIEYDLIQEQNNYIFSVKDLLINKTLKYKYIYQRTGFDNRIEELYVNEILEKNKNIEGGIITTIEYTNNSIKTTNNLTSKSRYDYFSLNDDYYVERYNTITEDKEYICYDSTSIQHFACSQYFKKITDISEPIKIPNNDLLSSFVLRNVDGDNINSSKKMLEEENDKHLGIINLNKWIIDNENNYLEGVFHNQGTKKDRMTLCFFYKLSNIYANLKIELFNDNDLVYEKNSTLYQFSYFINSKVVYVDPKSNYNKIKITINFSSNYQNGYISLLGFTIFKGIRGYSCTLDPESQLTTAILSNNGLIEYKYDNDNYLNETIDNGIHTSFERNEKGIPTKVISNLLINEKTYNSLNKWTINKTKSKLRNEYQEEVNNYNYYTNELKDEYLQNSVDINRNNTTYYWRNPHKLLLAYEKANYFKNYKYDILDRKNEIIYANINNIDYDNIFDELENNSFNRLYNEITYDDNNRVNNYSARDISVDFQFNDSNNELDKAQNLKKVKLNGITLEEYEYGLSTNNTSQYYDLLKSKKYSNGHKIIYSHDENDNINKITLQNENAVNIVLADIVYDEDNQDLVKSITDEYNNTTTFEYDNNEYVCKKNDSRGVIEESEINDNYVLNTVKNEKSITTYFSVNDFSNKTRKCFIETIQDINSNVYSCFFDENINMMSKNRNIIPLTNASFNLTKQDNVYCVKNQNGLTYELLHTVTNNNTTKISLAFWFYPVNNPISNQALINIGTEDENKCYLYIDPNGYVNLENEIGLNYNLGTLNKIELNTWNFLGLTLYYSDGYLKTKLYLNKKVVIDERTVSTSNFLECNEEKFIFNIGNKLENDLIDFTTGITSVIIDTDNEFINNEMIALYLKSKEYIIDYYKDKLLNKHIYKSGINYYKSCNFLNSFNFDMIPLNNTFTSYNKIKPVYIENTHSIKCDNNQYFTIDKDLNRPVYQTFGNDLKYDLNTNNMFSSVLKVKVNHFNDKNYILQLTNESNSVGLYVDTIGGLNVNINNQLIHTNLELNLNTWHTVIFSWNFNEDDKEHSFRIVLDSTSYEYTYPFNINCNNMILNIGCGEYAGYKYPLFGQIEQFMYINDYPEQAVLARCKANMNINTYYNTYDEFNHLVKKNFTEYQYKVVSNTFLTNLISCEVTNINNLFIEQRDYLYDNKDNITSVKVNNEEYRSYEYNHFNFLTKEELKNLSKTIEYSYNNDGNISSKKIINGTTETVINYAYSNNLLTSYNGQPITYNNGFINTAYLNGSMFTFGWKGKKLHSLVLDNTINIVFNHTYDGKRIKKTINIDTDSIEYNYYYSGDNLVREEVNNNVKGENYVVKYIYDENNLLIGLEYNNKLYYYIRDILGNINKIVDESGNVVTVYEYDAYGNVLNKSGVLSNINSFIYKGYYYDNETGLFYCNSRYYNPEWCRWISPDDIEYLDPESINGLNLYAYCGNDPINRFDPTGHDWEWSTFWSGLWMVGTAITAIALSVTTFGAGIPLAMSIIAGVTLGAGVLTGINGVATMIEAGTQYNFVRDGVFNGLGWSDSAYNVYSGVTKGVAMVGSMILGFYHATGHYKAAKESQRYLGKGYTKAEKNRWISKDGYRQVRWDTTRHPYKGKPSKFHFNWYEFKNPIEKGVRNELVKDVHVWLKWFSYYM